VVSADWQEARDVTISVGSSRKRDRISTDFRVGGGVPPTGIGGRPRCLDLTARVDKAHRALGGIKNGVVVTGAFRGSSASSSGGILGPNLRLPGWNAPTHRVKMGEEHTCREGGGSTASSRVGEHTGEKPRSNPCKWGRIVVRC